MIVLVLGVGTYKRNEVWRDPVTLWQDVAEKSPRKVRPYNNLGAALNDAGRPMDAIRVLSQAIRIRPDHPEAYYNLGRSFLLIGRNAEAVQMLQEAISLKPDYDNAFVNLAAALNRSGRFLETVTILEQRLARLSERADARFNLGVAYAYLGNLPAARRELAAVARLDARLAQTLGGLLPGPGQAFSPGKR